MDWGHCQWRNKKAQLTQGLRVTTPSFHAVARKNRLFGFAYLLRVQCPHTLHVHVLLSLLKKNKLETCMGNVPREWRGFTAGAGI